MPTYEYTCKTCGKNFEVLIKSAEKSNVSCPICKGKDLQEIYGFNTIKSSNMGDAACSFKADSPCSPGAGMPCSACKAVS
ncbi:MAG: zinc ribbon domain-containing protein [Firmicutes bacterium]|nr:zinc ribbon domain-containing protein [Bacillota bacterium]